MKMTFVAKVCIPLIILAYAIAVIVSGTQTSYASVPAAVTQSPEPATLTPVVPSNTPAVQPSDTPVVGATNTPVTGATNTTVPAVTDTPVPEVTNTTQPGQGGGGGGNRGVNISIRKLASTTQPTVGGTIEFTLIVNNTGDETAQDVVVTDPVPDFLQVTGATATRGTVAINGNTVTVTIGPVGAGDTVTITITATVVSLPSGSNNRNIASLTTTSNDQNTNDNTSSVQIGQTSGDTGQQPTPVPPTDTPIPGVTASIVPPTPAAPTPAPPASLPPTGGSNNSGIWLLLVAVGAASVAFGALLRRSRRARS